jgi:tRNA U34 5-methylaminomethyl-2-thiouridine-forming methyltransferase MnmC
MTATSRPLSLSFVVVECSGEMLSDAIDIAAALRGRGHTIDFAAATAVADRVAAAGFAVTPVTAGRFGRVEGVDQWLRATATDAVHLFGHSDNAPHTMGVRGAWRGRAVT